MPLILRLVPLPDEYARLLSDGYEVIRLAVDEIEASREVCRRAQVVWTNGMVGLSDAAMAALPQLEIIVCQGVGYDAVDIAAASRRGIAVVVGQGVNSSTVADHAMALVLSVLRRTPHYNRQVRNGQWLEIRGLDPILTKKCVGILGFGRIGRLVAQRARGFDCEIVYHSRHPVDDCSYDYAPTPRELARRCDVLVLCCPGGPETHHMVDAEVLEALGPAGYVVNVARGSVVDTDALMVALTEHRIAGAALDVIEGEPTVSGAWRDMPNVIFTPHTGGLSAPAFDELVRQGLASLAAYFAGDGEPVPGVVNS